ncbi:MAG: hypothetical protein QOH97_1338 [Actinoplanes sp.]|jgi:hypothetical protein|nr:hypothetical protein [Actinoplanes sp.]
MTQAPALFLEGAGRFVGSGVRSPLLPGLLRDAAHYPGTDALVRIAYEASVCLRNLGDFAGVFWPHYSRVFWPQAGFVRAGFVGARRAWWSMYRGARFGSLGSFGPA